MAEGLGMRTIAEMGLPDRAIRSEELPWVPQAEQVRFKPFRFDLTSGRWSYCIEGSSWRYLERDWVARRDLRY